MYEKLNENILIIGSYISGQLQLMIRLLLRLLNTQYDCYCSYCDQHSMCFAKSSYIVVGWIILTQWQKDVQCAQRGQTMERRSMALSGAIIIYAVKQLIVESMNSG